MAPHLQIAGGKIQKDRKGEEESAKYLTKSRKLVAGSIVLVTYKNWPPWPAIVDEDITATDYTVIFLEDIPTTARVAAAALQEFKPMEVGGEAELRRAMVRAKELAKVELEERLEAFWLEEEQRKGKKGKQVKNLCRKRLKAKANEEAKWMEKAARWKALYLAEKAVVEEKDEEARGWEKNFVKEFVKNGQLQEEKNVAQRKVEDLREENSGLKEVVEVAAREQVEVPAGEQVEEMVSAEQRSSSPPRSSINSYTVGSQDSES